MFISARNSVWWGNPESYQLNNPPQTDPLGTPPGIPFVHRVLPKEPFSSFSRTTHKPEV